jgi:hypothetical protein
MASKMKEIIDNVNGILGTYNISFNELNNYPYKRLLFESSDPKKLREFIRLKFHKNIRINDARELEILLLTYNYVSEN